MPGYTRDIPGGSETVDYTLTGNTGAPDDDIWAMLAGLLEDTSAADEPYDKLKAYLTAPRSNFRWDKNARDMLTFAQLAQGMDDESTAQQIMWQALSKGFRPNQWNPQGFGGLYNRWGLQYGNQGTSGQ